ncbi:glycosyltransferase family 2 protein [Frigidibacter sp. MR17.14]|uniref:glycosyltransferase family 2 protein n=1 Tax=Frigidibacter sp. MR17.14 TaxID=3126509 RepID=UPI003012E6FE
MSPAEPLLFPTPSTGASGPVPRISVILPAWNAAGFLERAVASVRAQQGVAPGEVEIVIVDDGSTDATAAVIARLAAADPGIVAVLGGANQGPAGARNTALSRARGSWIAVLDADDAYAPGRLARLVAQAEASGLDAIADLPLLYDLAAGCPAPDSLQHPAAGGLRRLGFRDFLGRDAATGLDLGLLKPVFHARLKAQGLLEYPAGLRHGEDCAMYVAMTRAGAAFGLLEEAHYVFSTRIGAVSGARSPGSVTDVDYRAVAAEAERLRAALAAQGEMDAELSALLDARVAGALQANRRYGWTVLRRREWGRLRLWLGKDRRNWSELARVLGAKLAGQRGLPG